MANKRHQPLPNVKGPSPGNGSAPNAKMKMKVPNFPGLPGKTGPNRSAGVKKLKTHPQEIGI